MGEHHRTRVEWDPIRRRPWSTRRVAVLCRYHPSVLHPTLLAAAAGSADGFRALFDSPARVREVLANG